jgi:hypothetical protein
MAKSQAKIGKVGGLGIGPTQSAPDRARKLRGNVSVRDMNIRVTQSAGANPDEHLILGGLGHGDFLDDPFRLVAGTTAAFMECPLVECELDEHRFRSELLMAAIDGLPPRIVGFEHAEHTRTIRVSSGSEEQR